jgi:hypothetical protein
MRKKRGKEKEEKGRQNNGHKSIIGHSTCQA